MKKNSKVYELAKINNEKIASLPKAIYSFNDILLKIPMTFYRAKKKCSLLQREAQRLHHWQAKPPRRQHSSWTDYTPEPQDNRQGVCH